VSLKAFHRLYYFLSEAILLPEPSPILMRKACVLEDKKLVAFTDASILVFCDLVNSELGCVASSANASQLLADYMQKQGLERPLDESCDIVPLRVDPPKLTVNPKWGQCKDIAYYMGDEADTMFSHGCGMYGLQATDTGEDAFISGVPFQDRYIWILNQLPGIRCEVAQSGQRMRFVFDHGWGAVMPLHEDKPSV